jgi:hypothetical protein
MMRDTGIGHIGIPTLSNTVFNSCSVCLTDINISRITTRAPKIVSLALKSMKLQYRMCYAIPPQVDANCCKDMDQSSLSSNYWQLPLTRPLSDITCRTQQNHCRTKRPCVMQAAHKEIRQRTTHERERVTLKTEA